MGSVGAEAKLADTDVGHRATQKAYWTENSLDATVEAMMLDSQAATIDKLERPEVCIPGARVCDRPRVHKIPKEGGAKHTSALAVLV